VASRDLLELLRARRSALGDAREQGVELDACSMRRFASS
jgi:hypothetical protein